MVGCGPTSCERHLKPGTCLGQGGATQVFGVTSTVSLMSYFNLPTNTRRVPVLCAPGGSMNSRTVSSSVNEELFSGIIILHCEGCHLSSLQTIDPTLSIQALNMVRFDKCMWTKGRWLGATCVSPPLGMSLLVFCAFFCSLLSRLFANKFSTYSGFYHVGQNIVHDIYNNLLCCNTL